MTSTNKQSLKNIRNVIVAGPTGAGKSSLLNFLANADKYAGSQSILGFLKKSLSGIFSTDKVKIDEYFRVGRSAAKSETRSCSYKQIHFDGMVWNFIDTPGLDDSGGSEQDVLNIIEMIKILEEFQDIHTVIFCYKSGEKATGSMRSVYDFFGKFFRICFPSNVMCVATHFCMNDDVKEVREYEGKTEEYLLNEAKSLMMQVLNVPDIPIFPISSAPTRSELSIQQTYGMNILNHIKNIYKPIHISELIIPKPALILRCNTEEKYATIGRLAGFFEANAHFNRVPHSSDPKDLEDDRKKSEEIKIYLSGIRDKVEEYLKVKNRVLDLENEISRMSSNNYAIVASTTNKYPIRAYKLLSEEGINLW
jgi:hypothetical protein